MSKPQVFVYRWGVNFERWGRNVTAEGSLDKLKGSALEADGAAWILGDTDRAPACSLRVRVGDLLLFYAGRRFSPGKEVVGVGLAGSDEDLPGALAVEQDDWALPFRWLPISRRLAKKPEGWPGIEREFAPSGPASTLLQLKHPSKSAQELIRRALRGSSAARKDKITEQKDERRKVSVMEGILTEQRVLGQGAETAGAQGRWG